VSKALSTLDGILKRLESAVLVAIMIALFGLVVLQVGARIAGYPPPWTEEAGRYLMVWLMFFGAAVCVRYDEHVGFPLLADMLGGWMTVALRRFANFVTLLLMLLILVQGAYWMIGLAGLGQRAITFNLPIYWVGLAVPVGGLLGSVYAVSWLLGRKSVEEPQDQHTVHSAID
jgi:TRAP-type C4-dicarboxylate transport system permease small subunit